MCRWVRVEEKIIILTKCKNKVLNFMNKTLSKMLMVLPLMVAATSCSEGDVTMIGTGDAIADGPRYIDVDVQTQRNTRGGAVEATVNELKKTGERFSIVSQYTGSKTWAETVKGGVFDINSSQNPFYQSQYVTWNDSKWTYKYIKEWPETGNTTFFSYYGSPYYYSFSDKSPEFTVYQNSDATQMVDALFALSPDLNRGVNNGKVKINFKHILTRLDFKISLDKPVDKDVWGETKVFVNDLSIDKASTKLVDKARFVVGQTAVLGEAPAASEKPEFCYWKPMDNATRFTSDYSLYSLLDTEYSYYKQYNTTAVQPFRKERGEGPDDPNFIGPASLFKTGNYLFLLPPSNDGITGEQDIIVKIGYTIVQFGEAVYGLTKYKQLKVALPKGSLKPGKAYLFNLIINPTEDLIKVVPTVQDWDTLGEMNVAMATAATADNGDIKDAWNQLVKQCTDKDQKFSYYVLKVDAPFPAGGIDISTAQVFPKPSALVKLVFNDGTVLSDVKDRIQLPTGYYIDDTVKSENIIRFKIR